MAPVAACMAHPSSTTIRFFTQGQRPSERPWYQARHSQAEPHPPGIRVAEQQARSLARLGGEGLAVSNISYGELFPGALGARDPTAQPAVQSFAPRLLSIHVMMLSTSIRLVGGR